MSDRRFPLCWPDGWKRTLNRTRAKYKVSEEQAKRELLHSLYLLGASDVILSTNVRLRIDGLPLSNQRTPEDPGVAVYFQRGGKEQVIACDAWDLIGDNYRAIGLAVEALRAIERSGASELLDRAFTGFAALPPPSTALVVNWRSELGLIGFRNPSREVIEAAYRAMSKSRHPDTGGSVESFRRLTEAREAAFRELDRGAS